MNTLQLPAYIVSVVMVVYRNSLQATDILIGTPLYLQWGKALLAYGSCT